MKKIKILLSLLLVLATIAVAGAIITKPEREEVSSGNGTTHFTNRYGTPNTTCAKSGCSRKIASSGDTAYCTSHSNRCLNCRCYIDGDAMYCMKCIEDAIRN